MKKHITIIHFLLTTIIVCTIQFCKKEEAPPVHHRVKGTRATSAAENHLFTIKENGQAALDVKSYFGRIIIYNKNTGTSLSHANSSYKITDSYGKSYEFTSSTIFGERTKTGLFGLAKIFKNNVQIYEEKYHIPSNFHVCGTVDSYIPPAGRTPKTSAIGASKCYWPNGSTITVNFFQDKGSAYIKERIEYYAHIWEQCANIKFKFVSSNQNADIRIDIDNSDKSSYVKRIGNHLLHIDPHSFNMHYGWFTDRTLDNEFSRTVLHEFGHALGLEHEHNSRDSKIDMNKYIQFLIGPPNNWTQTDATQQASCFTDQDQLDKGLQYSDYDPLSIMHYWVPADCTTDGVAIGGNNTLSAGDVAFIRSAYPIPYTRTTGTIYTIKNGFGVPRMDIVRDAHGLISIINHQPGVSLNAKNQTFLIYTRTPNGNWHHVAYTFSSSTALSANTSTGIINSGPILIERKDAGQTLGVLLFREK